jgi:hypothetical protein
MEDIVQAAGVIAKTAGEVGMTRDDLAKAKDLLQKYGDERDRLFDQMLSLLSKSDTNGITDDWKSLCEKGNDLLEGLNNDMPKSPAGEGLNGVGARDFGEGEKKVWAENGKGQLALVADVIAKVNAANVGLIQQCNDDLKTIRDGNAEVQSQLSENLDAIRNDLLDVANTLASKKNDKTLTSWMKEGEARNYVKKWSDGIVQRTDNNFKGAQQKGALKKQILDKIEMLNNAREQLDEKWIDDMYRSGEDCAKSLAGAGETGDYRALDWTRFGESCIEPLAESRDNAKEQSKTVFDELLPEFQDDSTTTFAGVTDDPSKLADWKSALQDKQESIQEALATEDEEIKNLAEGPYQDAARETFDEFRSTFADGMKLLFDKTKDAEDQLRV